MGPARIGLGYDSHRFARGRNLVLGGVQVPHALGLAGHSDADVLVHAVCDALLGGSGLDDIGTHFPDTDPAYEGRSSLDFLREIRRMMRDRGLRPVHVDATVLTEAPKLRSYIPAMRERMAAALDMEPDRVNVKAKTNEAMGFVGRGEGMAALAVALIEEAPTA